MWPLCKFRLRSKPRFGNLMAAHNGTRRHNRYQTLADTHTRRSSRCLARCPLHAQPACVAHSPPPMHATRRPRMFPPKHVLPQTHTVSRKVNAAGVACRWTSAPARVGLMQWMAGVGCSMHGRWVRFAPQHVQSIYYLLSICLVLSLLTLGTLRHCTIGIKLIPKSGFRFEAESAELHVTRLDVTLQSQSDQWETRIRHRCRPPGRLTTKRGMINSHNDGKIMPHENKNFFISCYQIINQ